MNTVFIPPLNSSIQVFLVGDYAPLPHGLAELIQGEYPPICLVGTAKTRNASLSGVIQLHPDIVLLDCKLSNQSSLELLSQLAVLGHHRILMLAGQHYSPALTQQTLALGASGVISKEAPAELLAHAIECAHTQGHWSELFTQKIPLNDRRHLLRHVNLRRSHQ